MVWCVAVVHFGFRKIDVKSEVQICLKNATMVGLRGESVPGALRVSQVTPMEIADFVMGKTNRYFSVTDECVTIKSEGAETVNTWIVPRDLCPGQNLVSAYGYSYEFDLRLSASRVTCLFFSSIDSRHHVNLKTGNMNSSFVAQFYTGSSLSKTGAETQAFRTSGACSFSAMEPFFVRLTTDAARIKTIYVSLASLHLPAPMSGCKTEEIMDFDEQRSPGRVSDISHERCLSPWEELGSLSSFVLFGVALFLVVAALLQCLGYVNWQLWFQSGSNQLFQELAADTIAHEVVHPSDVLHEEEEEEIA